jgi:hypothetical protein
MEKEYSKGLSLHKMVCRSTILLVVCEIILWMVNNDGENDWSILKLKPTFLYPSRIMNSSWHGEML